MNTTYGQDLFKRADSPQVVFHVEIVTGDLADSLRIEQAKIVMEVLEWVSSEENRRAAGPRQDG
ncbi:hypothetical protein ABH935_000721 [Catenulispora sp. GAS73]